jgi:hypothetical protein
LSAKLIQLSLALEGLTECLVDELDPAWNIKVTWHLPSPWRSNSVHFFQFKVTILNPGPYRTEISQGNYHGVPQHPAYADPALHTSQVRKLLTSTELYDGDVTKAAVVIEKLSRFEDAPIRFPLHKRVVAGMRAKAKGLSEVADKYESWTDGLYLDS